MNKLKLLILPMLLCTACAENEFQQHVSNLDLYKVLLVKSVPALVNTDQKASLHLKVVSHDNKPIEEVFLKPHKLPAGVNFKTCSKSDKDGNIICHFTSSKPGKMNVNLIRGNKEFSFNLDFKTIYKNSRNAKISSSNVGVQNLHGYQITSNFSQQMAKKEDLFGYLISTGIIFK